MSRPILVVVALAAGLVAGLALPRPWERPFRAAADGAEVARFDGGALGANDVARRAALQPPSVRGMLAAPAQRKSFVENLVKFELPAGEAVRKGYHQDPQFIQESKQRLGQILLDKDVEAPLKAGAPTEEDLKRYFEQNQAALSRPERIRIAAISFAARASNGELPFMTWAELAARYGEPLANAALALKEPGSLPTAWWRPTPATTWSSSSAGRPRTSRAHPSYRT